MPTQHRIQRWLLVLQGTDKSGNHLGNDIRPWPGTQIGAEVNFVYLAAALASYSRIVSMEDLQPVFEDMEEARRRRAHAREAETCSCDCT